jgi:hypothetical protein
MLLINDVTKSSEYRVRQACVPILSRIIFRAIFSVKAFLVASPS